MVGEGGTVAAHGGPRPTKKIKNAPLVLGPPKSQPINSAREPYIVARMYLLRKRCVHEPAIRLPKMLARPMRANDQLATAGGKPQRSTSPGRCVTRNAMWNPHVKKPACSNK